MLLRRSILINLFSNFVLVILLGVLSACSVPDKPIDIKPNQHSCSFCMMGIADMRFRGQIITPKGKRHHFDSLECMAAWSADKPKHVHSSWVGNHSKNGEWIHLDSAKILQSEKLKSPMGAGLAAFGTEVESKKAAGLFKAKSLSKIQLKKHIIDWRKDNSVK